MSAADYAGLIEPVARELCGEPNAKLSSKVELRFGTNGSLSVDLQKDTWYDHEAEEGGGVLALVSRATGRNDAKAWLTERGYTVQSTAPSEIAYDYVDEHGAIVFQVVRKPGHKFQQRRPDPNGGWLWQVKGVRPVPYHLPQLLKDADAEVYVVEGEKDADRMASIGLLATCNAGGAGKWRAAHAEFLRGRKVTIIPDNDKAGAEHAAQVAASLQGVAARVRVLDLPGLPAKGDVSDWLNGGGTAERLLALCAALEPERIESPLRLVTMTGFMDKDRPEHEYVMTPYLPRRVVTLLGGHGGVGKTTLALTFAAHVASGRGWGPFEVTQGRVVFLSFEDEEDDAMRSLQAIVSVYGLPTAELERQLQVFDGTDGESELAIECSDGGAARLDFTPLMALVEQVTVGADLVVIDNASDTYGGNENSRRQVKAFIRRLARQIARANNAAVVLLAHISKDAAKGGGKGENYSGSTAWHNGARSRLALVESDIGIELLHEKAQFGAKAEPVNLQRGDRGVLAPIAPAEAAAAKAATKALTTQADADNILAVIEALIANQIDIPTAETGQRTTYHVLSRAPEMPPLYRTPAGKERTKAAVMALERAGRICRQSYKRDRKERERWTLAHFQAEEAA